MKKVLSDFMDEFGFIGHKHPTRPSRLEFGDGTQRTGMWWIFRFLSNKSGPHGSSKNFVDQLQLTTKFVIKRNTNELKPQWVRHWDESYWEGQLWIGSRDNFEPWLTATILYGPFNKDVAHYRDLMLKELKKRFGLLWNYKHVWPDPEDEPKLPDVILPWNLWALCIRSKWKKKYWYKWADWLILWVLDLDTVANSLLRVWASIRDQHSTYQDISHQPRLMFKQAVMPTPTVYLAKVLYRLRRPSGPRDGKRLKDVGTWTAWLHYFNSESDPPFPEYVRPLWEKYVK